MTASSRTTTVTPGAAGATGARAGGGTGQFVVQCIGLTKVFKDFWLRDRVVAVKDVTLSIRQGEVFGLLGPNGSGKSTTIKMVLGLLKPTEGKIAVFGRVPEDVRTKQLIGYLPEESYLYRFLNARETLDYYGRLFEQNHRERQKRIDMLLSMVGLEHAQRRPVGQYSKGMQRKIGLAQALINDPQLLILDEPTTGMDPIGTRQTKDLILELKRRGKTVILCSHLLADVEDVCDRVAVMYGGKIHREGTVTELLTQEEKTTISTPELTEEEVAAVEAALAKFGKRIERVEHPRQKLEAFFDEVVSEAQKSGALTSGTTGGGRTAAFLLGDEGAAPQAPESERVIEELVSGEKQREPEAAKPTGPGAGAESAASRPVDEVIAELTRGGSSQQETEAAPSTDEADERVDEAVLDELVQPTEPKPARETGISQMSAETAEASPTGSAEAEAPSGEAPDQEVADAASAEEAGEEEDDDSQMAASGDGAMLGALYDKVPPYEGGEEPQSLMEEEEAEEAPPRSEPEPKADERPDEDFLRALQEADDEPDEERKKQQ